MAVNAPTRGKDKALSALEAALEDAKMDVSYLEGQVRQARYAMQNAEKALAISRRDVADLERSITTVREIPTLALSEFEKQAKQDPLVEDDGDYSIGRGEGGDVPDVMTHL